MLARLLLQPCEKARIFGGCMYGKYHKHLINNLERIGSDDEGRDIERC
jgi:hypothetical protein